MSLQHPGRSALFLSLSLIAAAAAQAADSNLYLQLGGNPAILGESTAKGHVGAINLDSLQWGVSAATSFLFGSGAAVGKAVPSDVNWTQGLNQSVPALSIDLLTGKSRPTGSFDLVKSGSVSGTPWLSLKTTDQFMTGLNFSNDNVAASAVAKTISLSYNPEAATGGAGKTKTVTTTWDISKNTATGPSNRLPSLPVNGNGPAAASGDALSMYLRLGDSASNFIAGDSTKAGYANWIELSSAQWGMSAETSYLRGTGAAVGKASLSAFTYTLGADATMLSVLTNMVKGTKVAQATIEYVKAGPAGPNTVMQLNLKDIFFTDLSLTAAEGEDPKVSESITFSSLSQTVWSVGADGIRGKSTTFGYDVRTAKASDGAIAPSVGGFGSGNLYAILASASTGASYGSEAPAELLALPPAGLVPEAQTWALMLAGLAGLVAVARRRRAAA